MAVDKAAEIRSGAAASRARPFELARMLPSGRSLAVGFALLVGGLLAYVVARNTSVFALRTVEVSGAPPALERKVRSALAPLSGESLLVLDPSEVERRLGELPAVGSASFDRAFPHTLRITISPERPVAVLRSGPKAWLLSAHAKVLKPLRKPFPKLPRIWIDQVTSPGAATVATTSPGLSTAVRLVAHASRAEPRLVARVATVKWEAQRITFVLRSGTELRLGSAAHLRLKLAVAARILRVVPRAERERIAYLDLSVPTRPVAGS